MQGERGAGVGGQKLASAELRKGCVSLGNCIPSPTLSHLHIQTAAVTEPEPTCLMRVRVREAQALGRRRGEHAHVHSCRQHQPCGFLDVRVC